MTPPTPNHGDELLRIGDVFTPLVWGEFAIQRFGIFDKWMDGARVFDPTMGEGALLESLITYGLNKGYQLADLPTDRLFGNEMNAQYYECALHLFQEKYELDLSNQLLNSDLLELPARSFDVLFGNPPWLTFADLPLQYKDKVKPYFFEYDLVGNTKELLLGGSRIDIAALMIQAAIKNFLKARGEAYFFLPLSILLNDGANKHFRSYKIHQTPFALNTIIDLNRTAAFKEVGTRYGIAHFTRDDKTNFPIKYERFDGEKWENLLAKPLYQANDPLSVFAEEEENTLADLPRIIIAKEAQPRQGLNTSGANSIFFFKNFEQIDTNTCLLDKETILPSKWIYPLLTAKHFKAGQAKELEPVKWVLIPHEKNGRPLSEDQLKKESLLWNYLKQHEQKLKNRKGTLIRSWRDRGYWWSLLGVGPYNFMPYKIVWEAYGRKTFRPIIVEGHWQANQSLQAFIPVRTKKAARKLLKQLKHPSIEKYLLSLQMEGTMNWAQPGKIKKLLTFK